MLDPRGDRGCRYARGPIPPHHKPVCSLAQHSLEAGRASGWPARPAPPAPLCPWGGRDRWRLTLVASPQRRSDRLRLTLCQPVPAAHCLSAQASVCPSGPGHALPGLARDTRVGSHRWLLTAPAASGPARAPDPGRARLCLMSLPVPCSRSHLSAPPRGYSAMGVGAADGLPQGVSVSSDRPRMHGGSWAVHIYPLHPYLSPRVPAGR